MQPHDHLTVPLLGELDSLEDITESCAHVPDALHPHSVCAPHIHVDRAWRPSNAASEQLAHDLEGSNDYGA